MNSFSEIVHACNLKSEYDEVYNKERFKGMPRHLTPISAKAIIKNNYFSRMPVVHKLNGIVIEFNSVAESVRKAKDVLYKELIEV